MRDTAQAMSQHDLELAARVYREFGRTGELPAEFLDPRIVWHTPTDVPEQSALRGPEAIQRYISGYVSSFDGFRVVTGEMVEANDRIIIPVQLCSCIKGTDTPVELDGVQVWAFDGAGRAVEVREYRTVEQALEAAGLSD